MSRRGWQGERKKENVAKESVDRCLGANGAVHGRLKC